jgi:ribosomal protein S18 acetylase RimI-like enzyme
MSALPRQVDDRPLERAQLREAAELAVRALGDDPYFAFLIPDKATRDRGLSLIHRSVLTHSGPGAHIRTVRDSDDRVLGVALWLPTDCYPQPLLTQLAQFPGALRAMIRHPQSMSKGFAYMKASAAVHPKEPHWYLHLIMTDPPAQRQGVGDALMHDGLSRIDQEGVGASLETQNEENIAYYARFGFELRHTLRPVSDGPPLFSLWRPPRTRD